MSRVKDRLEMKQLVGTKLVIYAGPGLYLTVLSMYILLIGPLSELSMYSF